MSFLVAVQGTFGLGVGHLDGRARRPLRHLAQGLGSGLGGGIVGMGLGVRRFQGVPRLRNIA